MAAGSEGRIGPRPTAPLGPVKKKITRRGGESMPPNQKALFASWPPDVWTFERAARVRILLPEFVMQPSRTALFAAAVLLLSTSPAAAVTTDGQLDAAYGTARVTQTTQTGLSGGQIAGDSNLGDLEYANGSELDAAYAVIDNGVLHLLLAGNLAQVLNQNHNGLNGHVLDVFFDTAAGGQNVLNGLGMGNPLNGFTFDAGFEADFMFELTGEYAGGPILWSAWQAALPDGGGNAPTLLGSGYAGNGALSGGTNPYGVQATIDNTNTGGVDFGCDAASGAGVTTGIEWAIPLAAIGSPEGCIRATVIVRSTATGSPVSNQMLAPAPPGTCPLGSAAFVNLASIAGDQFFTICPAATGVSPQSPAGLDLRLAGPNPSRGEALRFAFRKPAGTAATLRLIDGAGRIVRRREIGSSAAAGIVDLSNGARVTPGVYWAQLSLGGAQAVRRLCVVN